MYKQNMQVPVYTEVTTVVWGCVCVHWHLWDPQLIPEIIPQQVCPYSDVS